MGSHPQAPRTPSKSLPPATSSRRWRAAKVPPDAFIALGYATGGSGSSSSARCAMECVAHGAPGRRAPGVRPASSRSTLGRGVAPRWVPARAGSSPVAGHARRTAGHGRTSDIQPSLPSISDSNASASPPEARLTATGRAASGAVAVRISKAGLGRHRARGADARVRGLLVVGAPYNADGSPRALRGRRRRRSAAELRTPLRSIA